ncbi:MAG: riboflavin biosynthesis protein RibF [Hydrogenophilales bacterium 16-64-46]|nr:MAG: riboflavin biosynthesis protein RibF [Hydrogenophilales bacterium 12-64-13]OYZ04773.1 MAG: riboflavin biosynthesis protein RibF [Hydrogenophilales bacterium 16-64-46]OZA38459.1 MAG: riboflavin biosynthesis protein RibF [Hydrogenophilales bacterium 17-64-34]HQT00108.1 bifunctional riboflavin kinase/FAD synthetase [Thiobacillus sp.]
MRITHGFAPTGQPHAVTIGNFDGLHLGHKAMLARLQDVARARALPTCVLSFEPHPREFFTPEQAPARLSSLREKAECLRRLGIDRFHVFRFDRAFSALSAERFIERVLGHTLQARYVLVGDDFRFGARRAGDFSLLQERGRALGFDAEFLPTVEFAGGRASSTAVREALASGQLDRATQLLGRPYSMSGRVVHGDKLGRDIGFPTANIQLRHNRPPLMGIFAVTVSGLNAAPLPGVASLGKRPTVKNPDAAPVLEVHLFDFDADIYGRRVRVDFLHKLRDEEKYPDLASLVAQIHRDCDAARTYLSQRHA